MLRMGSCVRFCSHNIFIPSHYVRRRFPSVSAEFRCCTEIPLVNQKLIFDERIGCITRHDIFHREVIGQFHLLLYLEIVKAEAIVAIIEPVKPKGKRVSL